MRGRGAAWVLALVLLAGLIFVLRRDLALLDVLTLGKHQAINLGVDYDRSIRRLLLGVLRAGLGVGEAGHLPPAVGGEDL